MKPAEYVRMCKQLSILSKSSLYLDRSRLVYSTDTDKCSNLYHITAATSL